MMSNQAPDDILYLRDRILDSIKIGESDFREFKSAYEGRAEHKKPRPLKDLYKDIVEALVAFANTDGGEILIGVEDDGTVTGVGDPHLELEIDQVVEAVSFLLLSGQNKATPDLPIYRKVRINIDDKIIWFIQVTKGVALYQTRDGRILRRVGNTTVPAKWNEWIRQRNELTSKKYDQEFVDGAKIIDLDRDLLQNLANSYIAGYTVERYLQHLDLAFYDMSGFRLTRAAVLLFAKDVQRWHTRCQVRVMTVAGTELLSGNEYNVIQDESVHGNILHLIKRSWEFLRPFLVIKTEFTKNAEFLPKYTYPEEACREALLNAIVHRDYSVANGIEICIFRDRIQIRSPGSLLSSLTVKDLTSLDRRHESRNSKIASMLSISHFIRETGEGISRIFNSMLQNGLTPPKLYSNSNYFEVTLYSKSVFSAKQLEYLNLFKDYELSTKQKQILVRGMNQAELAPKDIFQVMQTQDRDTYDREVTGLRNWGLLEEIRTNAQALALSKTQKMTKQDIKRFKVKVPAQ